MASLKAVIAVTFESDCVLSKSPNNQKADERQSKATLIRLANSCARAATRGSEGTAVAHDLDAQDFKIIADILMGLAAEIPD